LIGKLNRKINAETRFVWQWRATPFGACISTVDYKASEHSKLVIRSFHTSSAMRLLYKSCGYNVATASFFNPTNLQICSCGTFSQKAKDKYSNLLEE